MPKLMDLYHEWNSLRTGISIKESIDLIALDEAKYQGGYSGRPYKQHIKRTASKNSASHDGKDRGAFLYAVLDEVMMRRQLSYPDIPEKDLPLDLLSSSYVDVLDYGCGVGEYGMALCLAMKARGGKARLVLCDFPGNRTEFALWAAKKQGIETEFLPAPAINLPKSDVVIVRDVLEHLHNPVEVMETLYASLKEGGAIWTNIMVYKRDALHVTPNLLPVKTRLKELGSKELWRRKIYIKPISDGTTQE